MTPEKRQWHWLEGNKYALECIKALLWLNSGAAIALLTFFGNRGKMLTTASADAIGYSLTSFGVGHCGERADVHLRVLHAATVRQRRLFKEGANGTLDNLRASAGSSRRLHLRNMVRKDRCRCRPDLRSAGPKPRAPRFTLISAVGQHAASDLWAAPSTILHSGRAAPDCRRTPTAAARPYPRHPRSCR